MKVIIEFLQTSNYIYTYGFIKSTEKYQTFHGWYLVIGKNKEKAKTKWNEKYQTEDAY